MSSLLSSRNWSRDLLVGIRRTGNGGGAISWLRESWGERPAGLGGVCVVADVMYESREESVIETEFADLVDVEYDEDDPGDMPRMVTELYAEWEGIELDACARSTSGDSAGWE